MWFSWWRPQKTQIFCSPNPRDSKAHAPGVADAQAPRLDAPHGGRADDAHALPLRHLWIGDGSHSQNRHIPGSSCHGKSLVSLMFTMGCFKICCFSCGPIALTFTTVIRFLLGCLGPIHCRPCLRGASPGGYAKQWKGAYASLFGNKRLRGVPTQASIESHSPAVSRRLCKVDHDYANLPTRMFLNGLRRLPTRIASPTRIAYSVPTQQKRSSPRIPSEYIAKKNNARISVVSFCRGLPKMLRGPPKCWCSFWF